MTAESQASEPERPRRHWAFGLLSVLIWGAAALVGGSFGLVASGMYGSSRTPAPHMAGILLGGGGGLLAGVVWCRVLVRQACRTWQAGRGGKLVIGGMVWGVLVGLGCAVILHAGLTATSGRVQPVVLAVGLLCGILAGLLTGLLSGVLTLIVAAVTRPDS